MKLASVLALVSACSVRDDRPPVATPTPTPIAEAVRPDPIAKGIPHSGIIDTLAVTEQGDAAISRDLINGVRLWPTLDGTRPPVQLHVASDIDELAIMHAGRDLVAILRDRAGSITVLRLGLDGSVRGKHQLAGGQQFVQVVTAGDVIVARTADHAIEWYAIDGTPRGRLVADAGQRITHLAARGGRVAAVTADREWSYLRWIAAGDQPRWELTTKLDFVPSPGMFAIAPGRRRVAYVDDKFSDLLVFDVELAAVPVKGTRIKAGSTVGANPSGTDVGIGFVDDDTVGLLGTRLQWWTSTASDPEDTDPWRVPSDGSEVQTLSSAAAMASFADGRLVTSHGGSLVLAQRGKLEYLGWSLSPLNGFRPGVPDLALMLGGNNFVFFDDRLVPTRTIALDDHKGGASWAYGIPIGSHHVIAQAHVAGGSELRLLDVDKPDVWVPIGERKNIERFFPSETMLGVLSNATTLQRFALDLEKNTVTEQLPSITFKGYSMSTAFVFDAERSGGLAAISLGWAKEYSDHQTLTLYRIVNGKMTKTVRKNYDGQILRADADGTLILLDHANFNHRLRVMRGDTVLREVVHDRFTIAPAINVDATRFAVREDTDIVMLDETGAELWRTPIWGANNLLISRGGTVIVAAVGGLVALDGATGKELARECGFNFGIHVKPPEIGANGFVTVCEDQLVQ